MTESADETNDPWALTPKEHELVMTTYRTSQLGFAILLVFFRNRGRFPRHESEVDSQCIAALGWQLNVEIQEDGKIFLSGRTAERLRAEIRTRFGFQEATVADAEILTKWLNAHIAGVTGSDIDPLIELLAAQCRELAIEMPTADRMERIARAAIRVHEEHFHAGIYERLSPTIRERLDELLRLAKNDNAILPPNGGPGGVPAMKD